MRIGILGSGLMGGKLGTLFARAGHEVVFSYARSRKKLERLARDAGTNARAGSPREAAEHADALLLAVHWSRVDDVLHQTGDLSGSVLVSCTLPMNADDTELVVAHNSSGAEQLAERVAGARVVSAFNTVPSEVLFGVFEGRGKDARPSLVYCGDDADAKAAAARLIRDVGFARPALPSRSRYSLHDSRTRLTVDRNWRTDSSGMRSGASIGCDPWPLWRPWQRQRFKRRYRTRTDPLLTPAAVADPVAVSHRPWTRGSAAPPPAPASAVPARSRSRTRSVRCRARPAQLWSPPRSRSPA